MRPYIKLYQEICNYSPHHDAVDVLHVNNVRRHINLSLSVLIGILLVLFSVW